MHASVLGHLGRFPATLVQQLPVLELVNLHLERAAALDHFLFAVAAEPPRREVAAGARTCRYIVRHGAQKDGGKHGQRGNVKFGGGGR